MSSPLSHQTATSVVDPLLHQTHDEAEATMQAQDTSIGGAGNRECCLVQIYPADVVDGMMLLSDHTLVMGRDGRCELILPDHSVSRKHAELIRGEDGYMIRDLASTNGTFVNGQAIDQHLLASGDTIRLGSFLFKYLSAGSVESQYHETVYTALTRDALTGTMNKRYLLESLQRGIASSSRQKTVLSVLMLDIDHFKSVNDTYGHLVGDEVLREFGSRINGVCREDDLLARYGGEEFCMMLSATGRSEAIEMAERCRSAVASEPFQTAVGPLEITASFGIACSDPEVPTSPKELIDAADQKLYEAKRGGRNRVCG
ncbi:GGDEF domain-containing protein [Stieleria varia]|uniref:diguanylate cyclase n=1 Tax=Stieleria varia TaxID=2528005 RepID=A0A5C6B376_9BACT|nr:GGDEF domain-containing protein [Stieleria varia]TWU06247.1 Response regulator PleD [Stieleria varia]